MNEVTLERPQDTLNALEAALQGLLEGSGATLPQARRRLAEAIAALCGLPMPTPSQNMCSIVDAAKSAAKGRRLAAILSLRALAVDGLLPFEAEPSLARRIGELIEDNFSDQLRALRLTEKRQTFEKLLSLKGFHGTQCQELRPFASSGRTLADIDALVPDLQRVVRSGTLAAYLAPYSWASIKAKVNQVCEQIAALQDCNDASFKQRFGALETTCCELDAECAQHPSFLTRDYVDHFAASVREALVAVRAESTEKFACDLEPRRKPPEIAAKRYPLHITDKWLTITFPFVNKGPGVAVDVQVELDAGGNGGLAVEDEIQHLGDVPPGEFAISFRAMVVTSMQYSTLAMQISWGELFGGTKSTAISIKLIGQDANIDWESLERLEPYSLDVAEGARFVGRRSKVQGIGNRLMRDQMSSTYITGQKRIGKTSLAQAVERYLADNEKKPVRHHVLYLEWGE